MSGAPFLHGSAAQDASAAEVLPAAPNPYRVTSRFVLRAIESASRDIPDDFRPPSMRRKCLEARSRIGTRVALP